MAYEVTIAEFGLLENTNTRPSDFTEISSEMGTKPKLDLENKTTVQMAMQIERTKMFGHRFVGRFFYQIV